jgi:dipeptidyl aminopeptidase/acylaminoacyl peptidase
MKSERIGYGADPNQFFEVWHPKSEATGFAVFIHGGFWRARYDLRHANPFCAALAERGILTANLEYRRVGQPGGGWPGTFDDVVTGVKAASEYLGGEPVVVGHSAGGYLALRLVREPVCLKAVVALAPVADLRFAYELNLSTGAVVEFLRGTPADIPGVYDEACASKHAASARRIVIHGTKDEDVPIELSRSFVGMRQGDPQPPSLVEIPEASHMGLIDPDVLPGLIVIDLISALAEE